MPRLRNNLYECKEDLAYYFQELSYGIKTTSIQFKGIDELINYALLDIVTGLFHSKPKINQSRFIDNLEAILTGIKKYHQQENDNDSES
jgi:hypothetical protein